MGGFDFRTDTAVVYVFNSIKYKYGDRFLYNCKKLMQQYNCYFLQDLPREDVVSAFKCSDVFLFASKKEVAPLVILESQAAGLPWVSLDVGDIENRHGGFIISSKNIDIKGYKCFSSQVVSKYISSLTHIICDDSIRKRLSEEGKRDIKKYDWQKIYLYYDRVFKL